jgi:DNA-binding beta-propeller fold protein YncE
MSEASIPEITHYYHRARRTVSEGTYQFLLAYADPSGNEISQYYALTNLVSVFDLNNIQAHSKKSQQASSDTPTSGRTRQEIHALKVAVIQNYDNTQSYVIEGLHTVTTIV